MFELENRDVDKTDPPADYKTDPGSVLSSYAVRPLAMQRQCNFIIITKISINQAMNIYSMTK